MDVENQRLKNLRDHIAMSGRSVDMVLDWGVDANNRFYAKRVVRWPGLLTSPGSSSCLEESFDDIKEFSPSVHDMPLNEGQVVEVGFDGIFTVHSRHQEGVHTTRRIFPASVAPVVIDMVDVINKSSSSATVTIPRWKTARGATNKGTQNEFIIEEFVIGSGEYTLSPGESKKYALVRSARMANDSIPYIDDPEIEFDARMSFLSEMRNVLVLETPEAELNAMFHLAKIRTIESVFRSKGGPVLAMGGSKVNLSSAWSDDQAEYVAPLCPYIGNKVANEGAFNMYRTFLEQLNKRVAGKFPSGIDVGQGLLLDLPQDRGDAAMIASGLGRFIMVNGDQVGARSLYPLLSHCLRYCAEKKGSDGVILSETDDLEGKIPAGEANLRTNMLYYDALISAACLVDDIDQSGMNYAKEAVKLKENIDEYFASKVGNFETYRYSKASGGDRLHYAITFPLMFGYKERAEQSTKALLNQKLWSFAGIKVMENNNMIMRDRYTLMALQGVMCAGYQDAALPYLRDYTLLRLRGSHAPYACDGLRFPGEQSPAESALYCRLFIEGMFGIRPIGFRTFSCTPRIPTTWEKATLKNIKAFGTCFNIEVTRMEKGKIRLVISDFNDGVIVEGVQDEGMPFDVPLPL